MSGKFYPCGVPGEMATDPVLVKDDESRITDIGIINAILEANGNCVTCSQSSGSCSCFINGFTDTPIPGSGTFEDPFVIPEMTILTNGDTVGVVAPGNGTVDIRLRSTTAGNKLTTDGTGGLFLGCTEVLSCVNVNPDTISGTGTVGDPFSAALAVVNIADSESIDFSATGAGTIASPRVITGDVIIAPAQSGILNSLVTITDEGVFSPKTKAATFTVGTLYNITTNPPPVNPHQASGLSIICETYSNGNLLSFAMDGVEKVKKFTLNTTLRGCILEGTITAAPAAATASRYATHIYDVNTSAGDIDVTGLGVITNVFDGAHLLLRNTGQNNILWTQNIDGVPTNFAVQGNDSLELCFVSGSSTYQIMS